MAHEKEYYTSKQPNIIDSLEILRTIISGKFKHIDKSVKNFFKWVDA